MSAPQLQAKFFVTPDGIAIPKARTLLTAERRAIFDRDGAICQYCGVEVTRFRKQSPFFGDTLPAAVDHVFPRARGGQNDPANLKLACEPCNAAKGAKS